MARSRAMQQQWVLKLGKKPLVSIPHLRVAGEEAKSPTLGDLKNATNALCGTLEKIWLAWIRHVGRQVEKGLFLIVEVRRNDELAGSVEAQTLANVIESARDCKGRRGENHRVVRVEESRGKQFRHVDRCCLEVSVEARVRGAPSYVTSTARSTSFNPKDRVAVGGLEKKSKV